MVRETYIFMVTIFNKQKEFYCNLLLVIGLERKFVDYKQFSHSQLLGNSSEKKY